MLKKLKVLFASDHLYNGLACVLGALAGLWAATTPRVLDEETTVLLAAAGAAVGLLAVVLTAMTLVIAFLDDFFGEVIEVAGTRRFFMPFVVVAFVSAADAVVAFAGALDSGGGTGATNQRGFRAVADVGVGPLWTRDLLFGVAAWLLVWAIGGACRLVWKLVGYAVISRETKTALARASARAAEKAAAPPDPGGEGPSRLATGGPE